MSELGLVDAIRTFFCKKDRVNSPFRPLPHNCMYALHKCLLQSVEQNSSVAADHQASNSHFNGN